MADDRAFWMTHDVSVGDEIDSSLWTTRIKGYLQEVPIANISYGTIQFIGDLAGVALLETTLEMVRLEQFPWCPSRLNSIFLWPSLNDARRYHNGAEFADVFEVTILKARNLFIGDFDLITYYPSPFTLENFKCRAVHYWSRSSRGRRQEIVLDGVVRVGTRCV